jgi:TolB-like protein/DNA-binding SARP family transcriptional activator
VLRIHTFGGCYIERDGTRLDTLSGQRKALALLSLLAAAGERGMSREALLAYLWSDSDEERARTSLKQLVHSLRTQLQSPDFLLPSAELRLNGEVVTSDVFDFREAVRRNDNATAASLYVGPFLDGFYLKSSGDLEQWIATERAELERLAARAFVALAEEAASRGDGRAAVDWWRRLAHIEPLSARAAVGLMVALDWVGERAAALNHARVYELLVREQVGGAPDAAVLDVVARLQRGEPATTSMSKRSTLPGEAPPFAVTASADRGPAEVEPAPPASSGADREITAPAIKRRDRRKWNGIAAAAALILLSAGAYGAWTKNHRDDGAAKCTSIAVIPFVNTSGDAANDPFSDGLTDELIGTLGKIQSLKVIGRTTSFAFKGKGLGVRAVADSLDVCAVLEGSVRREGRRVKATAQLVSTRDATINWTETFDRESVDAIGLQEEIARAIVTALRVKLASGADSALFKRQTADPVAYDLYQRGRYIYWQRTNLEGNLQAASYFEQAIARDSQYARAYSGLADVHARLAVFGYEGAEEEFAKAKSAAQRALALDSTVAEAHASLGHVLFVHEFDWPGSEREFRTALRLDPGYTFGRIAFSLSLASQNRFDEAIAQLDTARVHDPLAPAVPQVLGRFYVALRKPDLAIRALKQALELNPLLDLSYQQLGQAYVQKRMYAEAIDALQRAAALSGARDSAQLAYVYALAGKRAEAEQVVRSLVGRPSVASRVPFDIAMAYVGLGETDSTFAWLGKGFDAHASYMGWIELEPAFAPIHRDPRWLAILARAGRH